MHPELDVVALQKPIFSFAIKRVSGVVEGSEMGIAKNVGGARRFISVTAGRVSRFQVPATIEIELVIVPEKWKEDCQLVSRIE